MSWWQFHRLRMRDSKLGLLPKYRKLFGSNTAMYFRPGLLARGDGFDRTGGRLPRQLPRGPRGAHLMGLLDRYRQAPPSVFGRGATTSVAGLGRSRQFAGIWAISGAIRKMKPPAAAGPRHRVDGHRPAGRGARPGRGRADASPPPTAGRCRAGIRALISTFTCPAVGCGSTRCAVTPTTPTPTGSRCAGSSPAAADPSRCTTGCPSALR